MPVRWTVPSRTRGLSLKARKEWADRYAGTDYRELPWFSTKAYPSVRQAVAEGWWSPRISLLDIGCGAGTNSLYLTRAGFHVDGIDVAPGAVAAARARAHRAGLSVNFQPADALNLPFARRTFGGAIDIGCFHTLPPSKRALYAAELARVIRPGGRFALACAAREWTSAFGPPHRLSVEEIVAVFEPRFLVRQITKSAGRGIRPLSNAGPSAYDCILERRTHPQPPRR